MRNKILNPADFRTSNWSGGSTTEFFIYPAGSKYLLKNFSFRLSSAKVTTAKSNFTPLSGISRKLMVLDGKIILNHKDHYSKQIGKFETDSFEGDWETSSIGECTDFNLMTSGKTRGELSSLAINKAQKINYPINPGFSWFFIYNYSGKIKIISGLHDNILNQGCLWIQHNPVFTSIQVEAIETSELVVSLVKE